MKKKQQLNTLIIMYRYAYLLSSKEFEEMKNSSDLIKQIYWDLIVQELNNTWQE